MDGKRLEEMDFVFTEGGEVQLGTPYPLLCRLEKHRHNESPVHTATVEPFWIAKFCVTNAEYEHITNGKKVRPPESLGDNYPVTQVTYYNALCYAKWLSRGEGLSFDLPTEEQWVFASAPYGWEFPYQPNADNPQKSKTITFDRERACGVVAVDDPTDINWLGLYHIGGNVSEMTKGYYLIPGTHGYDSDGAYTMVRGGNFGHCPYASGVQRRGVMDVSDRSVRAGFRLVCNL